MALFEGLASDAPTQTPKAFERHVSFGDTTFEEFSPEPFFFDISFDVKPCGKGGDDADDGADDDDLESLVDAFSRFEMAKTTSRSLCPRLSMPVTLQITGSSLWQARASRNNDKNAK
eukprot:TRINITY_DN19939_c0_g1_i2.p1 TRINITY_DN19939_c0_g1~~TRINITY_DN19939_c0_g1_i2.p1  ORF type:complete len:134 (+),score=30.92 TRINITY_DN19939_c0_g1_i2:53-403(+)